jgi:outer membrane protein assembly factor BamA
VDAHEIVGDEILLDRRGRAVSAHPDEAAKVRSLSRRSSVGIGLIWESPFGPLRFDYAFPLSKEPYDRVQQFRFGGGTKL